MFLTKLLIICTLILSLSQANTIIPVSGRKTVQRKATRKGAPGVNAHYRKPGSYRKMPPPPQERKN